MNFALFHLVNGLAGRWDVLDLLGRLGADYVVYLVFAAVAVVGLAELRNDLRSGLWMAVTGLAAVGVSLGLAVALSRTWYEARPFVVDGAARLLIQHPIDSGFPSDHVTVAAAAVAVAAMWRPRIAPALAVGVATIGISRVFVGVHYPGDVLAGALLGGLTGIVAALGIRLFRTRGSGRRSSSRETSR